MNEDKEESPEAPVYSSTTTIKFDMWEPYNKLTHEHAVAVELERVGREQTKDYKQAVSSMNVYLVELFTKINNVPKWVLDDLVKNWRINRGITDDYIKEHGDIICQWRSVMEKLLIKHHDPKKKKDYFLPVSYDDQLFLIDFYGLFMLSSGITNIFDKRGSDDSYAY